MDPAMTARVNLQRKCKQEIKNSKRLLEDVETITKHIRESLCHFHPTR